MAGVIGHGVPICVALEPVDLRLGAQRWGLGRERMQVEPRSRALFVFVGKRAPAWRLRLEWAAAR